jgi:hypothetical protein
MACIAACEIYSHAVKGHVTQQRTDSTICPFESRKDTYREERIATVWAPYREEAWQGQGARHPLADGSVLSFMVTCN